MLPEERMQKICDLVQQRGAVRVTELSDILNTSIATVRRDLSVLNEQHRLRRTHGGAVAYVPVAEPGILARRNNFSADEKQIIAATAMNYIEPNDTIILDCSTSALKLAVRMSEADFTASVITNSVNILNLLQPLSNFTVIFIGGVVSHSLGATCGYAAENFLRNLRADKAFLGISGIHQDYGFSTSNMKDAGLKSVMMQSAGCTYALADHTKFGKSYLVRMKDDFYYIITDKRIAGFPYEDLNVNSVIIFGDDPSLSHCPQLSQQT